MCKPKGINNHSLVSLTPDIYVCMYLSINYVRPII